MQDLWYAVALAGCVIALGNWRAGIYIGVLLDCLRDPVRKLLVDQMPANQSVLITVGGAAVWGAVLLRMLLDHQSEIRILFQRYPSMRGMLAFLLLAIIPGAIMSAFLYPGGWKLSIIGSMSYLVPVGGIFAGYFLADSEQSVYRILKAYSILNGIMLIGAPLEYFDFDVPGLGGIDVVWVRYRTGYTVDLISGFYRSPDIMGLHAAHVMMFSALLFLKSRSTMRGGWIALALWAAGCVLLSGRRKMIGIPIVFLATYLGIALVRRVPQVKQVVTMLTLSCLAFAIVILVTWDNGIETEYTEYTDYAGTIVTEGTSRMSDVVLGGPIATLKQVGVMGAGIGIATQGRYYVNVGTSRAARGWQEDGVSRLLAEFGIPGLLFILMSGICLMRSLWRSLLLVPPHHSVQALQIGALAVVFGDMASAMISHQQFSGDPVSALLATILAGVSLGAPRIYAAEVARRREQAEPDAIEADELLVGAQ